MRQLQDCRRKRFGCRPRVLSPGGQGAPYIDTIPPGTITDLEVIFSGESGTASRIEFTRPGDDGFEVQSTIQFQIRYSPDGPIETELSWNNDATIWPIVGPFTGEWNDDIQLLGVPRSIALIGIDFLPFVDTWIAIRYRDAAGNVGGISTGPGPQQIIIT